MAKMRIYALANELNIESKEIIKFLAEKEITGKVASSSVEDDAIEMVRNKFASRKAGAETKAHVKETPRAAELQTALAKEKDAPQKTPSQETIVKTPPQTEAAKAQEGRKVQERPKKKASITAVFNPQNSKTAKKRPARPQGDRNGRPQGDRNNRPQGDRNMRPQGDQHVKPQESLKPQTERAVKPQAENTVKAQGEPSARPQENTVRHQGENTAKPQADRNDRPQGNRNMRPQGERNMRPQGDRNNRPQGDRNNRPQGDRNMRPQGDRNNRFQGERNNRPQGERNMRPQGDRNNRFQGDRNNRPQGDRNNRPQGDRNNRNFQNGRAPQKSRFEQEINKLNQNSPSSIEDTRGKESRDRDNRKGNSQRHEKELMGRKKERFDNLEKKTRGKKNQQPSPQPQKKEEDTIKTITLPEKMTIKEFADRMKVQASMIIKKLFLQGNIVTVNNEIDFATAEEIALEFNCICEMEEKVDVIAELLKEEEEDEAAMVKRPPVVCVMGHVDHGKTSLLDAIRDTHVIDKEAGGITQHIGAYMVECNGEKITFLDTPGHEAFTAMRMRGANATDIAILVVAADDGVMPQTVEAISHAKAAGVEIIVAINKIDKPSANIERVKQELAEHELIPEDWGGSTIFVPVSAHTHEGIESLLEMVLLTAEVCELKANPKRNARGLVIEAQLDKGRGSVATVLVQKGTLKVGQPIACGSCYGKVRAMIDDKGRRVKEASPSTPVEILGLNNVPNAGEVFVCTDSEREAKSFADTFISEGRERMLEDTKSRMSLDDLFSQIQSGNIKELPIIVKADVQGSVEAVKQSLVKLSNEEVMVKVIHGGVGAINESDVSLASASNAIIIGFNVRPDATAKATAEREGVDMRLYKVIYNAIEDVQAAMKGMLDPIFEEKVLGHAEIRQIFKASGVGNIAGSYVLDGTFQRGCKVRISREGEQIFEGDLASLKRFKDDVKEVRAGYECGLVFDGFNEIQELDVVEAYTMVEVPR